MYLPVIDHFIIFFVFFLVIAPFIYLWWIPHLCAFLPTCNGFLIFTSGGAPADLGSQHGSQAFLINLLADHVSTSMRRGSNPRSSALQHNALKHSAIPTWLLFVSFVFNHRCP